MRAFLPGLPGQPPAGPPISHTLPLAVVQVRCGLYLLLEVTRPFCAVWMSGGRAPTQAPPPGRGPAPEVPASLRSSEVAAQPVCPLRGLGDVCGDKREGFL